MKNIKDNPSQSKEDKLKIQIPTDPYHRLHKEEGPCKEIELTMADLQKVLTKKKLKKSVSTVSLSTTNTVENRKKLQELHKQLGALLSRNKAKFKR